MIRFFNRFYVRISSLFLVLLLFMGAAQVFITVRITERRQDEIDQLVNWNLARDMVAEIEPVLKDPDLGEVGAVIHYMMVLNPAIEIYLLDPTGTILAFFAEPGKEVKQSSVDLHPIQTFIQQKKGPIYGEDPRHPGEQKHFSAAVLSLPSGGTGYLYIVLRSTLYDTAAGSLRDKYLISALVRALILAIAVVGISGLILFAQLTRRVQTLAHLVRDFEQGNYDRRSDLRGRDEIGELGQSFNRMAATIKANMQALKDNDQLRRELIANVSHDLRSPLTSIQGYVETLLMKHQDLDRVQVQNYLQIILSEATMLNRLVHELFELSKFEARQIEPKIERFSLAELIQDVTLKYRPRAENQGISLSAKHPEQLFFVRADINMIERVLSNLIENALKHTPLHGSVVLELMKVEGHALVRVRDTGKGIPEDSVAHIFDRFYFRDSGGSKGSGLGLAIAQQILQLHNGSIDVHSELGKGTEFLFQLPLTP